LFLKLSITVVHPFGTQNNETTLHNSVSIFLEHISMELVAIVIGFKDTKLFLEESLPVISKMALNNMQG